MVPYTIIVSRKTPPDEKSLYNQQQCRQELSVSVSMWCRNVLLFSGSSAVQIRLQHCEKGCGLIFVLSSKCVRKDASLLQYLHISVYVCKICNSKLKELFQFPKVLNHSPFYLDLFLTLHGSPSVILIGYRCKCNCETRTPQY